MGRFEAGREFLDSELHALVGIEDPRPSQLQAQEDVEAFAMCPFSTQDLGQKLRATGVEMTRCILK
jgi:hypothetical protein